MKVETINIHSSTIPASLRGGVLSIGKFDGVHLGHATVLRRVKENAQRLSVPAIALTFDPLPGILLHPHSVHPVLTMLPRKTELIAALQMDALIVVKTDRELLNWTAEEFFQRILIDLCNARFLVEGASFTFGRNREGDGERLIALCEKADRRAEILPPCRINGAILSSSRVRSLIHAGQIESANQLLTRAYQLSGRVIHGDKRGTQLGFPTANLTDIETLLPQEGVYAGFCEINGHKYPVATHVGQLPTFGQEQLRVESFIIGFSGDLYGKPLAVNLLSRLRSICPFDNHQQLTKQIRHDVQQTQTLFSEYQRERE
ncbi:MAG: riboflavin biosynthesis protein RibF [Thermoguttaceae bacterium]